MKKFYLLIILFFVSVVQSFGQNIIDSKIVNQRSKFKETEKTKFKSSNDMVYLNDSTIAHTWNLNGNFWDPYWKSYNTFDNRGNLSQTIHFMKDYTTSQFKIHEKNTYMYNSSDQLIMEMFSWWDETLGNWFDGQKTYHFYNSQGKIVKDSSLYYDQSTSAWYINTKSVYNYDNNGYLINFYNYSWNANWEYMSKVEYYNNSSGQPITIIYYNWDSGLNNWENNYKTLYSYNLTTGDILEMEGLIWNSSTSNWDKQTKVTYLYNSNNKLNEITYYLWSNTVYVLSSKLVYSYDTNGNEIESIMLEWNNGTSAWDNNSKSSNFWSLHQISSVIQPIESNGLMLFPNPVKDYIYIDGLNTISEIKIFSIDGKLVDVKHVYNSRIDVSNLKKSLYIITFYENGILKQKKFIKH